MLLQTGTLCFQGELCGVISRCRIGFRCEQSCSIEEGQVTVDGNLVPLITRLQLAVHALKQAGVRVRRRVPDVDLDIMDDLIKSIERFAFDMHCLLEAVKHRLMIGAAQ